MFVPTLPQSKIVDENGHLTNEWRLYFEQQQQNSQQSLSDEGFAIPNQTSSNISLIQPKALNATLLFNSSVINGGSSSSPNGQLYVKLQDGAFHPITNS